MKHTLLSTYSRCLSHSPLCTDPSGDVVWSCGRLVGHGGVALWDAVRTCALWGWEWRRPFWGHTEWWSCLPYLAPRRCHRDPQICKSDFTQPSSSLLQISSPHSSCVVFKCLHHHQPKFVFQSEDSRISPRLFSSYTIVISGTASIPTGSRGVVKCS